MEWALQAVWDHQVAWARQEVADPRAQRGQPLERNRPLWDLQEAVEPREVLQDHQWELALAAAASQAHRWEQAWALLAEAEASADLQALPLAPQTEAHRSALAWGRWVAAEAALAEATCLTWEGTDWLHLQVILII